MGRKKNTKCHTFLPRKQLSPVPRAHPKANTFTSSSFLLTNDDIYWYMCVMTVYNGQKPNDASLKHLTLEGRTRDENSIQLLDISHRYRYDISK